MDMEDPELDRIFSYPISRHIGGDGIVNEECDRLLRGMHRRAAILFTSRTGSEYLASLLRDLGIEAHEHLIVGSSVSRGHAIGEGEDPAKFVAALCRRVPNRILCTKVHMHALARLFEIGEFPSHIGDWRFMHLSRANVVRQAISLLFAALTGAYRSDLQPASGIYHEDFTFSAIAQRIEQIFMARDWLERFLLMFEIRPLRIVYEDLVASPQEHLSRIARFLDIPVLAKPTSLATEARAPKVQSTNLNQHLEKAFRAEFKHRLATGLASREFLLPDPGSPGASADLLLPRRPAVAATAPTSMFDGKARFRMTCQRPFEPEIGKCWLYRLGPVKEAAEIATLGDRDGAATGSPVLVLENQKPLGPAHASHSIIRSKGLGAFSHWGDILYFSTSDNSDPNTNGRQYEIVLPMLP
jgi:LPS sulfotransferase NodH